MRKILTFFVVIALVSVTGFFVALGVLGGTFAGVCASSDAATLKGADNRSKIYTFWIENGYSPAVATGITASLKHESGYSPFRQEESQRWPAGGYGIAQFTAGQRQAATTYMAEKLGSEFHAYYSPQYGGAVSADNGYVPKDVPPAINDKFLAAQLGYLQDYISKFRPATISVRVSGFQSLTGIEVPRQSTLQEVLKSLSTPDEAAKAWTFLYEYPANTRKAAIDRGVTADALYPELTAQGSFGILGGADQLHGKCGVGNVVAPTNGEGPLRVTSGFGIRTRSKVGTRPHNGIDITTGSTIQAVMDGTVKEARYSSGLGWMVKIDHDNGTITTYGHMVAGSLKVFAGQVVSAGQPLGTMGNTGDSEGVHLHFEVVMNNERVNPYTFLMDQGIQLEWSAGAYPINTKPGPL